MLAAPDHFRQAANSSQQSYAAGTVSGADGAMVGGLIGKNRGGLVFNTYATGSVAGGNNAFVGGLIGGNVDETGEQSIPQSSFSYSIGVVVGGSGASVGGLFGIDTSDAENSNLYWDMDTSGVNDSSRGAGNIPNDPGITGLSDAQLKSGLPAGFEPSVWNEKPKLNNHYPYLIDNPPPKNSF